MPKFKTLIDKETGDFVYFDDKWSCFSKSSVPDLMVCNNTEESYGQWLFVVFKYQIDWNKYGLVSVTVEIEKPC